VPPLCDGTHPPPPHLLPPLPQATKKETAAKQKQTALEKEKRCKQEDSQGEGELEFLLARDIFSILSFHCYGGNTRQQQGRWERLQPPFATSVTAPSHGTAAAIQTRVYISPFLCFGTFHHGDSCLIRHGTTWCAMSDVQYWQASAADVRRVLDQGNVAYQDLAGRYIIGNKNTPLATSTSNGSSAQGKKRKSTVDDDAGEPGASEDEANTNTQPPKRARADVPDADGTLSPNCLPISVSHHLHHSSTPYTLFG
jgi:hypothetical protein